MLLIFLITVGIIGFLGNILVLWSLKAKKKTKSFLKVCSFEKNFTVYIKSLAISDIMSSLISVPCMCVELNFDLFRAGWRCKMVKYLILLFPCVTMNNLLVISVEKHFSTRKVPRTFRHSTVKKLVLFAWLIGCLNVLLPTATVDGLRFEVKETHYTVVCRLVYSTSEMVSFKIRIMS